MVLQTEVSYSLWSGEERQKRKGRSHWKFREKERKLEEERSEIKRRINSKVHFQAKEKWKGKEAESQQRKEGKNKGIRRKKSLIHVATENHWKYSSAIIRNIYQETSNMCLCRRKLGDLLAVVRWARGISLIAMGKRTAHMFLQSSEMSLTFPPLWE